jgi:Ca2+-transporting ATPase
VTASAIDHVLGIECQALTGTHIATLPDEQLKGRLDQIGEVVRVSPDDKILLVTLLHQKDIIVAMTSDGDNDVPALKKADIGAELGI